MDAALKRLVSNLSPKSRVRFEEGNYDFESELKKQGYGDDAIATFTPSKEAGHDPKTHEYFKALARRRHEEKIK